MRRRPFAFLLLAVGFSALFVGGGPGAYAAWLLYRGDFSHLERLGSERYFLPAVRAYMRHRRGEAPLLAWATRRCRPLLPGYDVCDIKLHSSGFLIAALSMSLEEREQRETQWGRLVALDPRRQWSVVADTGPLDLGTSGLELQFADIFGDGREEILLSMFGNGCQTGWLYRLGAGRFVEIPCEQAGEGFHSRGGVDFIDLDHDGVLEIRGERRQGVNCSCGRESQNDVVTWKFKDGRYRPWTIRGEECGPTCERPWKY
jgi:hypothetical protein